MLLLLTVSLIFQLIHAQQVIPLNSFKGGNVDNRINATPPFALYVSAHMDSDDILRQIYVKTDDNQVNSLSNIKGTKSSSTSGLMIPMLIQSTAYVSTLLEDSQMASLDGFIYITTTAQSADTNFKVFEVAQSQIVRTDVTCDPCTLVFLNTNSQMTPIRSSTFTSWQQSPTSVVTMYQGVPADGKELNSSQIFSNPIQTTSQTPLFLPTVEKFSVSLGTFYLRTTSDFEFVIQPYYYENNDIYTTSGYHSTGLYMKSRFQPAKKVTILCVRDTRFNGTTGANVVGSFPNTRGTVRIDEDDEMSGSGVSIFPANQILGWSTKSIGENITISSTNSENGEYFVQYYVYQDQQISSTFAPGSPTTPSVETTTKGVNGGKFYIVAMIFMIFSMIL